MTRPPRRKHLVALKAKVALAAVRGETTLAELATQSDPHPNQVTLWRVHLLEHAAEVFGAGKGSVAPSAEQKVLDTKVGEIVDTKVTKLFPESYFRKPSPGHSRTTSQSRQRRKSGQAGINDRPMIVEVASLDAPNARRRVSAAYALIMRSRHRHSDIPPEHNVAHLGTGPSNPAHSSCPGLDSVVHGKPDGVRSQLRICSDRNGIVGYSNRDKK